MPNTSLDKQQPAHATARAGHNLQPGFYIAEGGREKEKTAIRAAIGISIARLVRERRPLTTPTKFLWVHIFRPIESLRNSIGSPMSVCLFLGSHNPVTFVVTGHNRWVSASGER